MDNGTDARVATPDLIEQLAQQGSLPAPAALRALEMGSAPPPAPELLRLVAWFCNGAGSAFILAGVVFFFAYNWADLGRFGKLGLLELAIVAAVVGAWLARDGLAGHMLLVAGAVLVGPLLAVYGQSYQTGADAFELFVGWALLIAPWVLLARSAALWMLWLAVANAGALLFWAQILDVRHDFMGSMPVFLALFAFNGVAWLLWEFLAERVEWLRVRWAPRLIAVWSCAILVTSLVELVLGELDGAAGFDFLAVVAGLALVAAVLWRYRGATADLFMVAVILAAVMTVVTTGLGRLLLKDLMDTKDVDGMTAGVFLLGAVLVAEVGLAAVWLRREAARLARAGVGEDAC